MNDSAQKLNAIVGALLILSSVLGVVLLGRGKSGTPRPPQTGAEPQSVSGSQTVPNRLWQDPFEALGKLATNPVPTELQLINLCRTRTNYTTVLAVFLEGTPYPEDKETRRRLRYAVELALLTSDFAPADRNHIGVETVALRRSGTLVEQKVAFEWFARSSSTNALVLWLPEEDFAEGPLRRLDQLCEALGLTEGKSDLVVIGPRSSDTLRAMAPLRSLDRVQTNLPAVRIFSPHATAPDSILFEGKPDDRIHRDYLQGLFTSNSVRTTFRTWIATDQQLSARLVEELKLREIPGKQPERDVVVLISEADTFYGRCLPQTLQEALTTQGRFYSSNIWHFKYLRGLEGIKAEKAGNEGQEKVPATPEDVLQAALAEKGELAEGESQQDYARRFASYLRSKESRFSQGGIRIRAIGLTGNDFYDKLVLLQELRWRFPEAVFLTTDLKADYWANRDQLDYTRNLLVASSYPLEPDQVAVREQFMPFRDVYQASSFAACRAALRPGPAAPAEFNLLGQVYEIGRHGPVTLRTGAGTSTAPAATAQVPVSIYTALMGAAVLVAAFFTLILRRPPELQEAAAGGVKAKSGKGGPGGGWRAAWRGHTPTIGAILGALVFFAGGAVSQYIADCGAEEPWSFTDGVSIWPTEAIRVLALLLAVRFLVAALGGEQRHCDWFWAKFFQPEKKPRAAFAYQGFKSAAPSAPLRERVSNFYQQVALGPWHQKVESEFKAGELEATKLFEGCANLGRPWKRGLRLAVNVVLLVLGLGLVFLLLGGVPTRSCVRGELSRTIDFVVLVAAVIGFFAVLFYAIDATRLANRLLTYLEKPTVWPGWLKKEIANELCLCKADADPLLDMRCAVELTKHVRGFMLCPFVLLLLLLISRLSFFEAWTWPVPLVGVFILNFVLAAACWAALRGSAQRVRVAAVRQLTRRAVQSEHGALLEHRKELPQDSTTTWIRSGEGDYTGEKYAQRLRELVEDVQKERGGAFAPWVQDPTYLFLFIPTGVTGILSVALHFLLN